MDTSAGLGEMRRRSVSELYKCGPQMCHSGVEGVWEVRNTPKSGSRWESAGEAQRAEREDRGRRTRKLFGAFAQMCRLEVLSEIWEVPDAREGQQRKRKFLVARGIHKTTTCDKVDYNPCPHMITYHAYSLQQALKQQNVNRLPLWEKKRRLDWWLTNVDKCYGWGDKLCRTRVRHCISTLS